MFDLVFLSAEFIETMEETLRRRYARYLADGEGFTVTGEVAEDAWTVCVTFENGDRSLHLPVEAALVVAENPRMNNTQARDVLVDFVDYYFDRYFKSARLVTLPIDWKDVPFGECTVRVRGWEKNLMLEEAADRLLAGEPVESVLPQRR